ncbi:MAG: hypothetical protein HY425_02415 [Candidatus Levybacteria bacterium]|nr:hypothetical protein [Candidatus Levybacteria bacterium]
MPKENQPQDYQFKHTKKISMDRYRGVASDLMRLNSPVTDGFMQAVDMRSDIEISNMRQDRVADYDQMGTGIAKIFKLPRLDLWHPNGATSTMKQDEVWHIAVNDEKLSEEILQQGNSDFNKRFTARFQQEVAREIKICLAKEKLLNNGEYGMGFSLGYLTTIFWNISFPPIMEVAILLNGGNMISGTLLTAGIVAASNFGTNALNLGFSGAKKMLNKYLKEYIGEYNVFPGYKDPLIRHHVLECVMPPIPVDRVARGLTYMKLHEKELVLSNANGGKI